MAIDEVALAKLRRRSGNQSTLVLDADASIDFVAGQLKVGGTAVEGGEVGGGGGLTGWYDVTEAPYLATGDGTTDDTAAIQAAADAAAGGVLYFPAGTYVVTEVTLSSGTRATGVPGATLKLKDGTEGSSGIVVVPNLVTDTDIDGLTFDGNDANVTEIPYIPCISIGGQYATVRNCVVADSAGSGITVLRTARFVKIVNNTVLRAQRFGVWGDADPAFLDGPENVVVHGNTVDTTGVTAIYGAGKYWTFTGNVVRNGGEGGISGYADDVVGFVVAGNVVENCENHGTHLAGTDLAVVGNIYRNVGSDVIMIAAGTETPATSTGFVIVGNTAESTTGGLGVDPCGIEIINATNGVISGNRLRDSLGSGIWINGIAFGFGDRCSDITITGNEIDGADEHGILVENGDRITITGNTIRNVSAATANTYDGIHVDDDGTDCTGLIVSANQITDANSKMKYGINIVDATSITVSGNLVLGHQTDDVIFGTATFARPITSPIAMEGGSISSNRTSGSAAEFNKFSAAAFGPVVSLAKSRGAAIGTQTIVQAGDDLGSLTFSGSDGANWINAANILGEVDGTPGTNDMPGRLVFQTTPDAAAAPTDSVLIGADKGFCLVDGITAPATRAGWATLYVDTSDGDLKVKFGDGTVKVLAADT
jgi:parallel beta-helix repeat protein